MLNRMTAVLAALVLAAAVSTQAQPAPGGEGGAGAPPQLQAGAPGQPGAPNQRGQMSPGGPGMMQEMAAPNALLDSLFPPELVMQNQQAINLNNDQSTAIRADLQETLTQTTNLMWQQNAEAESLAIEIKKDSVDSEKALAHLDKLMSIENQIKRARMELMLKVKKTLSAEQQTKLRELMKEQTSPRQQQGRQGLGQPDRQGPPEDGQTGQQGPPPMGQGQMQPGGEAGGGPPPPPQQPGRDAGLAPMPR